LGGRYATESGGRPVRPHRGPSTAGPITAGNGYHPQCNPCFHPITSAAAVDAAEATGNTDVFSKPFGGSNPYEFEPGNVLICPVVSSHA